ncbi:DUF3540 domain-containing protein [Bosea sp. R86505]|uniref:DUF3540 domain-containing protein n=1 Tax=Bosea sp. R86505 TaxID=3101710 RepID=UPI00366EE9BE
MSTHPVSTRANGAVANIDCALPVSLHGGLLRGLVRSSSGSRFEVAADDVSLVAVRAVSCLVEPMAGDEVLVFPAAGTGFVLAVLTRKGVGDATLSLPDAAGSLTIHAPSVRLEASTRLDLDAPEMAVTTRRLHIVTDVLTQIARLASVIGETLTTAVGRQSTIARQLDVKTQDRNTTVSGLDNERVGTRVTQSELSTASAAIVTVHARDDIRLDAKRVTIG